MDKYFRQRKTIQLFIQKYHLRLRTTFPQFPSYNTKSSQAYHENSHEAMVLMLEAEAVEGGILLLRLP